MPLELRLAWRNVWRNPRRTGLTVAATVFAVVLVVFFVAMAAGLHEKMIEDAVRIQSGHVALAGQGYFDNRTLEQFVEFDGALRAELDATPGCAAGRRGSSASRCSPRRPMPGAWRCSAWIRSASPASPA